MNKHEYRQKYLKSFHWRKFKAKLRADGYLKRCYICGTDGKEMNEGIEPHHISYKNIGKETADDIVPLCETCHDRVHVGVNGGEYELEKAHYYEKFKLEINYLP